MQYFATLLLKLRWRYSDA